MPMLSAEEAAEQGKNLSFEKVWAAFIETDRKFAETDRKITKLSEEFSDDLRKLEANIDRASAEVFDGLRRLEANVGRVSANVGGLNRSLGELIETLIASRLWEKFPEYDLRRAYQRVPIYDEKRQVKTDVDILLADTVLCMAVEVKRELDQRREVDEHVRRMALIRRYPPAEVVGKELLGAMAGGFVDAGVREYAQEKGFYVLELSGDSVRLIPPPEGFTAQKW
jgi:regulator of replication initiation timing